MGTDFISVVSIFLNQLENTEITTTYTLSTIIFFISH